MRFGVRGLGRLGMHLRAQTAARDVCPNQPTDRFPGNGMLVEGIQGVVLTAARRAAQAASALRLPASKASAGDEAHGDNTAILQFFWRAQEHRRRCLLAFAMALHPRLGASCPAQCLDEGIAAIVASHVDHGEWLGCVGAGCEQGEGKAGGRGARAEGRRRREQLAAAIEAALEVSYAFRVVDGWSADWVELEPVQRMVDEVLAVGPEARFSYAYAPPPQVGRDCLMMVDVSISRALFGEV